VASSSCCSLRPPPSSTLFPYTTLFRSDMYLLPDLSTFRVIPYERGEDTTTARVICDTFTPDGKPFPGDPSYVLRRAVEEARALRSEEHTSELQSRENLVCRLLLEKKKH